MVGIGRWSKETVLITVRTYPVPTRKSIEVSCAAGITSGGRWIRLFPIPYRLLSQDKRFRKYQTIEANIAKAASDVRPESYNLDIDSIKILSEPIPTDNKWEGRKAKVLPLQSRSLCALQRERDQNQQPTLGIFKPKAITSLRIEPTNSEWTEGELSRLRQYTLFGDAPKTQLEKLPFNFIYEFRCDEPECRGHRLSCTDWEMGAAYRAWRYKYHARWEEKFRDKFETKMALVNDTYFFVGTLRTHNGEWIIVGLFYPPK